MRQGWVKIFVSKDELQAKLAEDVLKQADIESHIVSRPDSVFPVGEAELYIHPEHVDRALEILRERDFIDKG